MYKLAIFDMDGTLLNTLADLAMSCNYALSEGGFPTHGEDEYKAFVGRGPIYLIENALPENARDEATIKRTRQIFEDYYSEHSMDLTKPYDGTLEMLNAVRGSGMKISIYSNKPHDKAVPLAELFFDSLYDSIAGFRDGVPPKPEPDTGREIMRRFGVTAKETVYIGDSDIDMQAAKNLGVYAVGVTWGFRTRTDLENSGADVIVDKMDDLIKIIVDKP